MDNCIPEPPKSFSSKGLVVSILDGIRDFLRGSWAVLVHTSGSEGVLMTEMACGASKMRKCAL